MLGLVKDSDAPRHAVVGEVPDPEPGRDDVVIAVEACGICGTDLTLYDAPAALAREMDIVFPIVPGHEISGRISSIGRARRRGARCRRSGGGEPSPLLWKMPFLP